MHQRSYSVLIILKLKRISSLQNGWADVNALTSDENEINRERRFIDTEEITD